MPLAREAYPYLLVGLAVAAVGTLLGFPYLAGGALALSGFVAYFFRDPERSIPSGEGVILSPGDGRVMEVSPLPEGRTRIAIFLSLTDVHITRAPVGGLVKSVSYRPGRFLPANLGRASLENERNDIVLDASIGETRLSQIAGIVARRIVCRKKPGDRVAAGERIGLIQFGSRLEIVLPPGIETIVSTGARVTGGTSILAKKARKAAADEEKELAQANAG